jgi:hypothetical protein
MRLSSLACVLAAAGLLAGCGGKSSSPPPATDTATVAPPATTQASTQTFPSGPVFTSASDVAACAQLERTIQNVSQLVSSSTEAMTQALHAPQLAKLTGNAQRSLVYAAKVIALVDAPKPLVRSQSQLISGLRLFAADFGRAKASTANGDIASAAQQLVDREALGKIQAATTKIDKMCGA